MATVGTQRGETETHSKFFKPEMMLFFRKNIFIYGGHMYRHYFHIIAQIKCLETFQRLYIVFAIFFSVK